MGQVCSGSAGEEAAVSCPRSDAKRPGAAPKALGVCFSDFFGVGNLLGCRLHRGPEAVPTEGGGQGRGNSAQPSESSVPGTGRSFPEGKLWELFLLRGVQQMEGLAVNELIPTKVTPPFATLVHPQPSRHVESAHAATHFSLQPFNYARQTRLFPSL